MASRGLKCFDRGRSRALLLFLGQISLHAEENPTKSFPPFLIPERFYFAGKGEPWKAGLILGLEGLGAPTRGLSALERIRAY